MKREIYFRLAPSNLSIEKLTVQKRAKHLLVSLIANHFLYLRFEKQEQRTPHTAHPPQSANRRESPG